MEINVDGTSHNSIVWFPFIRVPSNLDNPVVPFVFLFHELGNWEEGWKWKWKVSDHETSLHGTEKGVPSSTICTYPRFSHTICQRRPSTKGIHLPAFYSLEVSVVTK